MEREWAISSLDLHLDLHRGQRPPGGLRAGLEAALRGAVRTGRLGPGTRLPSSRALAGDLGLARNTVADAYSQLVAEGWLTAERGSGTRVAERVSAEPGPGATPPAPAPRQPARYTLMAGSPDVSAFPRSAWLAATRRALTAAPSTAFGYSHPQGRPELRAALAGYLARARGVRAHPDRIVVSDGFTDGLALLARVLRQRGARTVAVEEYGLPTARATITAAGLGLTAVPVDDQGAVLAAVGPAADALLLTPAHQFPLGAALAPARRTQAAEWARTTGGLIIEDDYDGEFRYDRQPVGAVQALAPEHVVYAGSASKSLAPGFRLGWLVLPAGLAQEVAAARELAVGPGSRLDQLTLAEFIGSGAYDRHVRRSRLAYRRRQDRLAAALRREAPRVRVTGVAAGLHALCELPAGQSEAHVVARAAARGLEVDALDRYRAAEAGVGPARRQALVVGYGSPPEHAFSHAVARLCAALNDPW
ncbi:MAG TPA: PLP-dependent aminotransferase family protein [Streptosporangiaceae bacterium]|nr:PLP-dependent aminotransferase family protein [Streptosporangiaceae bacterium]